MLRYNLHEKLREVQTKHDAREMFQRWMKNFVVVKGRNNTVVVKDLKGQVVFTVGLSEINDALATPITKQESLLFRVFLGMLRYNLHEKLREVQTKHDAREMFQRWMKNFVVVKGRNNTVVVKDLKGQVVFTVGLSEINDALATPITKQKFDQNSKNILLIPQTDHQEFEVLNKWRQLILESDLKEAISKFQTNDLKIPLHVLKDCTQAFNERNFIGKGGYGRVYKGILTWADHINQLVAVKRLDITGFQGNKEFHTEVTMLSEYKHKNIITLIGFCDDNKEMILVYEYASHGSLDTYLSGSAMSSGLSWRQLLNICIGMASALDYLHNNVAEKHRIIHRDVKSANVLLDENWNAKLSDFGLARIGLANQHNTFVITNPAGTYGYTDPQYERTGFLTKESDVYSFGVVLFEVLCGRLACVFSYHDERRFLHHLARTCYKNGELDKIIDHRIKKDINPRTLSKFVGVNPILLKPRVFS